jgi:hypothetical protein
MKFMVFDARSGQFVDGGSTMRAAVRRAHSVAGGRGVLYDPAVVPQKTNPLGPMAGPKDGLKHFVKGLIDRTSLGTSGKVSGSLKRAKVTAASLRAMSLAEATARVNKFLPRWKAYNLSTSQKSDLRKGIRAGVYLRQALPPGGWFSSEQQKRVGNWPAKDRVFVPTGSDAPSEIVDLFLGKNAKMEKAGPYKGSGLVFGLSLLPYSLGWAVPPSEHAKLNAKLKKIGLPGSNPNAVATGRPTVCAGASLSCKATCLVWSGQNMSEIHNYNKKWGLTMALMHEPVAFVKCLIASIEKFGKSKMVAKEKDHSFVRLNVFSDIPWEEFAPSILKPEAGVIGVTRGGKNKPTAGYTMSSKFSMYDYTKVHGRVVPSNYDLTYSYSGANEAMCGQIMGTSRGRLAVVFAKAPGHKSKVLSKKAGFDVYEGREALPEWLIFAVPSNFKLPKAYAKGVGQLDGYRDDRRAMVRVEGGRKLCFVPVFDGDTHDMRPLDPAGICVGLRYKSPFSGTGPSDMKKSAKERYLKGDETFVVPVGELNAAVRGVRRKTEVASVVPRHTIIEFSGEV